PRRATPPPASTLCTLSLHDALPIYWNAARDLARRTQLVLAGGLNAGNVAAAIAAVRPFGVDVSSGVELEPGIKNPLEIASFVRAARAASGAAAAAARSEDES